MSKIPGDSERATPEASKSRMRRQVAQDGYITLDGVRYVPLRSGPRYDGESDEAYAFRQGVEYAAGPTPVGAVPVTVDEQGRAFMDAKHRVPPEGDYYLLPRTEGTGDDDG